MSSNKRKNKSELTPAEQKTTATFKLLSEQKKTLEKSLRTTQDELEYYRGKYHEADKNHALERNKNNTLALHEILKFLVSIVCGGIGVNFISSQNYLYGLIFLAVGIFIYAMIVVFDRK